MKISPPKELLHTKRVVDTRIRDFFFVEKKEAEGTDLRLKKKYDLLEEYCLRGGKRLRAYLVVLGYKIAGKQPNKPIYDIALGVELVHTALLIHDDIIDNDSLRRGKPTLHISLRKPNVDAKKSIAEATQLGNILFSLAFDAILSSDFPSERKVACAKALGFGSVSTAAGELMDIVYSYKKITQNFAEKILLLKTARYSVSQPLVLGYLLGGGKKFTRLLQAAGEKFGTAFQIRDDTLGIVGAKSLQIRGGDVRESKPFILAPFIEKKLSQKQKAVIQNISNKKKILDSDIARIRAILEEQRITTHALKLANLYVTQAKKELNKISQSSLQKEIFDIVDYVLERDE